jgi:hypothetical protein
MREDPMALDDFLRTAGRQFAGLGRGFMMNPYAGQRGEELGLDFFQFYAAGRAGVLGDVDGQTVADAFYFFNPELVSGVWESAKAKVSPSEAAKHYAAACADWGRDTLADIDDLETFCKLADRVTQAADPTPSSALFAAWRDVELPDNAPGRAALHITLVLREHRGGAHVDAVKETGVSPVVAVATNTPYMLQIFGWTDEAPDTAPYADALAKAEERTDELVAPAFSVLDEGEQDVFARVIAAMGEKLGS